MDDNLGDNEIDELFFNLHFPGMDIEIFIHKYKQLTCNLVLIIFMTT